jgi:two-component system, OmpR family, response regulator ResD
MCDGYMKNFNVLVADDEFRIRKLLAEFLTREGYKVLEAEDGEQAIDMMFNSKTKIDLVILDVMMPKFDGWFVLERIREFSTVPVVMLTARSDEYDQLKGFKLGADDYVTKPFSPSVLMARINKIVKREKVEVVEMEFGVIRMSLASREVFISGKRIDLTPKEFELLKFFIDNKGIALSRDKILNAVWNYDYFGDLRTVDTHIKQLRSKLGDAASYISTVRSIGYRLDIENENLH